MTSARIRFDPEPIAAAIPPSKRGYVEAATEPARPGQIRLWLHGDDSPAAPRSILLTHADIRRLCAVLHRMMQPADTPRRPS
jgi:hypothetical protein